MREKGQKAGNLGLGNQKVRERTATRYGEEARAACEFVWIGLGWAGPAGLGMLWKLEMEGVLCMSCEARV
jgi:hypothetical protein